MSVAAKTFASLDDLAVFGAPPLFSSPRPIGQLAVPPLDAYLALVKKAFGVRQLTGNGEIVRLLEEKTAGFHGVRQCVAVANAGLGLIMLAQLFARDRRGEVVMPSFSYRGLPHFAQWAGQMPRFCDVDESTHGMDPKSLAAAIGPKTTSIVGVCNFNSPGDVDGLCKTAERHGVPIVFDSVYAVGSTYRKRPLGSFGRAEVFSFHATKLLNGFEGGYITTNDDGLADVLRWQRDGAPEGGRPKGDAAFVLGTNARLNELHAALAYLMLDRYDAIVAENRARFAAYGRICAGLPGVALVPYADEDTERRNYQMAVIEVGERWPLTRDETIALLRAEGAAITGYYSPPLHKSAHAPAGMEAVALPVSERLAERFLQLPVGSLVSLKDIAQIGALLEFAAEHGEAIHARLSVKR